MNISLNESPIISADLHHPRTVDGHPVLFGQNYWIILGGTKYYDPFYEDERVEGCGILSIRASDNKHFDDYALGEEWVITVRTRNGYEYEVSDREIYLDFPSEKIMDLTESQIEKLRAFIFSELAEKREYVGIIDLLIKAKQLGLGKNKDGVSDHPSPRDFSILLDLMKINGILEGDANKIRLTKNPENQDVNFLFIQDEKAIYAQNCTDIDRENYSVIINLKEGKIIKNNHKIRNHNV